MDSRKAISPILATVILIAVTLVIAIGVIGWIMGVWGSIGGPSESLTVTGGRTAIAKSGASFSFNITITNKGTAAGNLSRVEVSGIGSDNKCSSLAGTSGKDYDGTCTTDLRYLRIRPGGTVTLNITITGSGLSGFTCIEGATYSVNVYTATGNVYPTQVSIFRCK